MGAEGGDEGTLARKRLGREKRRRQRE